MTHMEVGHIHIFTIYIIIYIYLYYGLLQGGGQAKYTCVPVCIHINKQMLIVYILHYVHVPYKMYTYIYIHVP